MSPSIRPALEGLQRMLEDMGSSHLPEETFIATLACSIADHREASERAKTLLAATHQELEVVRSLAASEVTQAADATFEAQTCRTAMESLQSEIDRLICAYLPYLLTLPSLAMILTCMTCILFQRALVPGTPTFNPASVASSSQEAPQLAELQAELAHLREMLWLREEELVFFRSTHDQVGPSILTQPSPVVPPVGPESQEIPFSTSEPPPESAPLATLVPKPTPQLDPINIETVAHLLREHEDLIREWEEFRLQAERALVAEELLWFGLLETFGCSLHDAEFELTMERQVIDVRL